MVSGCPRQLYSTQFGQGAQQLRLELTSLVGGNDEVARFQHVSEMLYGLADGQQLPVVGAVFLLGWVQLPGEGEGLPGVVDTLLQNGTHGGSGGVRDECKWCGWVGVRQ
jgi:hypothetical protein